MAHVMYWFSARQQRMRNTLGGNITYVKVGSEWIEYTQSTSTSDVPTVWPDFKLVAEGDDLECYSMENPNRKGANESSCAAKTSAATMSAG